MAGTKNRLSAAEARHVTKPGLHADGGGLYLQVTLHQDGETIRRSWVLRVRAPSGKIRSMGLGPLSDVTLAQARERADEARRMARQGIDPIAKRSADRAATAAAAAQMLTFKEAAEAYVKAHRASWRNAKHAAQWDATLEAYAYPVFGPVAVADVSLAMVLKTLEGIWSTKTETASRLRGRIEAILDWATVRGYRTGENPARWKGHLQKVLPPKARIRPVKHHSALPFDAAGDFVRAVREVEGVGPRALEFTILCAVRTGETRLARCSEFDLEKRVWTIPASRTKTGKEHRVPLSDRAAAIVRELSPLAAQARRRGEVDPYVFPGHGAGKPISNMTMLMVVRRLGQRDLTTHGFRSTFRDWASERTSYAREVAEAALGHAVGDRVEAAYRRGDLFEKRRKLMQAWAEFIARPAANGEVISISKKQSA